MDTIPHKSDFASVNGIRLHYLDWGGSGEVLLFLAGWGCNAHIFEQFAPRFTDNFHVLALTRRGHGESDYPKTGYDIDTLTEDIYQFLDALQIKQAILVGHSLAGIELSHFNALHPERVLKLVFLDAAYDRSTLSYKEMIERNPLRKIQPPGLNQDYYTYEEYFAAMKRAHPMLSVIWSNWLEEQGKFDLTQTREGKIIEKVTDDVNQAIQKTFTSYLPEYDKIKAPALAIYATDNSSFNICCDWMTPEQVEEVNEHFVKVNGPWQRENIEHYKRNVPHARIVEIPMGHHYVFIKEQERVYNTMHAFLLESN
jgi:non-heme chloroperoxidase